jgi:hypothetical protein
MKVSQNISDPQIIYLKAETEEEKSILRAMWTKGIQIVSNGNNDTLGIAPEHHRC